MRLLSALFLVSVFFPCSTTWAFDCKKANLPSEKAICDSQKLFVLDSELATSYKKAMTQKGANNKEIKESQILWISERNTCGSDKACLEKILRSRIDFLNSQAVASEESTKGELAISVNQRVIKVPVPESLSPQVQASIKKELTKFIKNCACAEKGENM